MARNPHQLLTKQGQQRPHPGYMRYKVPLALVFLIAGMQTGFSQENYVPPTYRESVAAQNNPNWVPSDRMFEKVEGNAPREPEHPYFDVDWSILLSTTHTGGTDIGKNNVALTPEFSLTHVGLRGQYVLDAAATISVNDDQLTRLNDGVFAVSGQYELDSVTDVNSSVSLNIARDDVNAPGTSDTIVETPYQANLQGQAGIERQFGKFSIEGSMQAERLYRSPTQLIGDVAQDNAEYSFVRLGGSLRTSYAFSPEIGVFVQGDVARDWYDAAPLLTGIKLDGVDIGLSVGATVNWRDVLSIEASVGQVLRQYVDPGIADRGEAVYALSFDFNPNDALSIGGQISTSILPENVTATRPKSIAYSASGNVGYAVAPWLGLRAIQSGRWVFPNTGVNTQTTYTTGFGVDVAVNKNLAVNLDYLYTWAEVLPTAVDPEYQHAATIGIRYSR